MLSSRTGHVPDHLEDTVSDNEHLTSDFALATDEVARCEDVRTHLEYEVVQKFRLALVKYRHLRRTYTSTAIHCHVLVVLQRALTLFVGQFRPVKVLQVLNNLLQFRKF